MPVIFDILLFKLVNYSWSCSQKPINDNHLVQVDESWHLMKHQIKHQIKQVFIWGETYFSSEIKHLHFNGVLLINTTHGNNEIPEKTFHSIISYCFIWEDITASCFHLFLGVWNPWWSTLSRFLHITQKSLWSLSSCRFSRVMDHFKSIVFGTVTVLCLRLLITRCNKLNLKSQMIIKFGSTKYHDFSMSINYLHMLNNYWSAHHLVLTNHYILLTLIKW